MNVSNVIGFGPLALFPGIIGRQPRNPIPLKAAVQGAPAEIRDRVPQASENVIQREERPASELDDDRFFGGGQYRTFWLRPHWRVRGLGSVTPFQDGFDVEPVLAGEETGRRFRRFELGSNSRGRTGAAVKNACHSALCGPGMRWC